MDDPNRAPLTSPASASSALSEQTPRYQLALFVSGASATSRHAIVEARSLCDTHLGGLYDLAIHDLVEGLETAVHLGVLAAPTLVKSHPPPEQRYTGDLSHTRRVLDALGLTPADVPPGHVTP